MTESELQIAVANYIATRYPRVMFHSDFGTGVKLTPGQARKQAAQNAHRKGWPDMFIAEPMPRCVDGSWDYEYSGLFIELKKDGTRLKKKDGSWATSHIADQAEVLERLWERGYDVAFAVGYEEAVKIIDRYLSLKEEE